MSRFPRLPPALPSHAPPPPHPPAQGAKQAVGLPPLQPLTKSAEEAAYSVRAGRGLEAWMREPCGVRR